MFKIMKNNTNDQIQIQHHRIPPVYDNKSKVLILGSFPSVKSREANFYYGHPKNRFWKLISAIFEAELPQTESKKRSVLLLNNIALWDVVAMCKIKGSSDTSISDVVPNDIETILKCANIEKIFFNGKTAQKLYDKHFGCKIKIPVYTLPSSSPANASYTFERLLEEWSEIKR